MTTLLLTRSFSPMVGGIERFMAELFRRVPAPVVIVAPSWPGDEETDASYPHAVHRFWYPWSSASGKLPLLTLGATAIARLIATRPSLVISDQVQTAAAGIPIARLAGAPHVVFAHGLELTPQRLARAKSWALHSSTMIIANSSFTRDTIMKLYAVSGEKIRIVHPGIDAAALSRGNTDRWPTRETGPVLIALGRLDATQTYKGFDRLIRLTARLWPEFPGIRCVIGGSGSDLPRLEAVARDARIAERVDFRGRVDDPEMPNFFREGDLFVLPSGDTNAAEMRVEGYGMVYAEAAAAGLPAIAYRLGGVSDVITDGVTGLLTDPNEDALFIAAQGLLRDGDRMRRFGREAARRAREVLDWNVSVESFRSAMASLSPDQTLATVTP